MDKIASIPPRPFSILVAAAGSGERAGGGVPKQYRRIGGKMLLRHTLDGLISLPGLAHIRVIIGSGHEAFYNEAVDGLDLPPPCIGGADRQESVYRGLIALSLAVDDLVLIHDAARPFVQQEDILALVRRLDDAKAATLAVPVVDTLRHISGEPVDRRDLWALQTPQGFHYSTLVKAHETARGGMATDDTALVSQIGVPVEFVEGNRMNFKITTHSDFVLADALLCAGEETRTATGFDVHAFGENTAQSIRLCGIDIPCDRALAGHSDADVGLHALTDALLGTIADGDIGSHFPPSNPQWRGMDSAIFLKHAADLVRARGGSIVNLDLTLICEFPKVGPHRDAMRARIAEIAGLTVDRVSVKATTTERLGFTGRREGIAAQSCASVRFKPSGGLKI